MPLLPSAGQLTSKCSLKSSNERVDFRLAPPAVLSNSPSLAVQWLLFGVIGYHPDKSLPLNSGSGELQAVGALRSIFGAGTPATVALGDPAREMVPVILSPAASRSQVTSGLL